jgi:hypothetical protein
MSAYQMNIVFIASEIRAEAARAAKLFPKDASCPDGTRAGGINLVQRAQATDRCDRGVREGTQTFAKILEEEFWEVMCEEDKQLLRRELVQVAGICVQWIDKLDRESANLPEPLGIKDVAR